MGGHPLTYRRIIVRGYRHLCAAWSDALDLPEGLVIVVESDAHAGRLDGLDGFGVAVVRLPGPVSDALDVAIANLRREGAVELSRSWRPDE